MKDEVDTGIKCCLADIKDDLIL